MAAPAAALAFRAGSPLRAFAQSPGPLVKTASGALRGASAAGIRIFRGVPFAEPPVGDLRFRPTEKVKPWQGERDATQFGTSPMQFGEPRIAHSEDCLQLNIWAPEGKGPYPVFVWIHGGGFTGGHAFEGIYDGSEFAREGVVCVTVAYRLGVFGFLDMAPLLGDDYAGSGNSALRDLITALSWIRENIADFGGDPDHVTIGGESAGAKLTDILMGVPEAQPLFQQMISESGGAERVWPQQNSFRVAQGYGDAWKKQSGQEIAALRTAAATQLIQVQHDFISDWPQHFPLRCEIDGDLLPKLPVLTISAGNTKGKRLLIGTNRDESALFVGPHPTGDATAKDIGNITLEQFLPVYRKYKAIYPELSVEQLRIRALSAEEYWVPSIRVADAHIAAGGKTWMYRLDFLETSGRLSGYAYHSLDIPLVWDKPHATVSNAAAEAVIAKQMHIAWVAFIKGETPAAPGLPTWPEYTGTGRETMILDVASHVEQKPQEAELRLWDHVL
ncbi:carboxylesterase/lipase family protein [Silvibacterium dinghuense]|uniref:Carboxylic ester hydrolase n=1 Tax=Silvibacterium dinghuense TaxID=1560006 RepID=A0A4Q1SBD7_9BACT|nr:carboxylesterase family protein [Silvibacterium dinghuense]RXS94317.1 carboxylesterase/lipase family protein [Silvibacterium dinghuense]GGH16950.1 carboxylic ester hydrolase [Silvibacterium dinghuense]